MVGEFTSEPEARQPIVFAAWRRTSGSLIAENARPFAFTGSTLRIAVRDKNWQRQLADHSREYLFKINSMLKGIAVDRVEFVIQPSAFDAPELRAKEILTESALLPADVTDSAKAIVDNGLRDQFLKAAAAAETRNSNR